MASGAKSKDSFAKTAKSLSPQEQIQLQNIPRKAMKLGASFLNA